MYLCFCLIFLLLSFFFKQKTAYEMRISDWSSDVCSSDLLALAAILGEPIWPTNWGPLVALAFFSQIVGQGLLVWVLRHFSSLVIGLALLTQPAVAALTGYAVFGEVLSPLDILGMVLVGGALALARGRRG